jgi:rhodanese-related sulfurtransferase
VSRPPSLRFRGVYAARPAAFRIDADHALELAGRGAFLLDVRRGDDTGTGLPGAERVAPDDLPGRLPDFPRDVPIVLACS